MTFLSGGEAVETLVPLVDASHAILVFSGAGISTPSGIPDYRGPAGVWNTRRPVFYQDFMTSEPARLAYWQQKAEDHEMFGDAKPNAVHHAIARLERMGKIHKVVTQNVDGLHRKAGTSESALVEIHGTVAEVECQTCGARSDPDAHFAWFVENEACPRCECGGFLKSATISFGQQLRSSDMVDAMSAARSCDLVMSLGSSLVVYPAADIPLTAARSGAPYVIVNRGETDHDRNPVVTARVEDDISAILPAVVDLISSSSDYDDHPHS